MLTTPIKLALAIASAAASAAAPAADGPPQQSYQQPSAEIRAVLDAKALPSHLLSPDQRTLATLTLQRHRTVAELARPVLRLAGKRLDAATGGPQLFTPIEALTLRDLAQPDAPERAVALPPGGAFHQLRWSPDGRRFLLNRRTAAATELWVGDVASAKLDHIKGVMLNHALVDDLVWLNADEIIALTVPTQRGAAPQFDAPTGPVIQEAMGRASPEVTRQDLLKNAQDDALFGHVVSSALRRIHLKSGASQELGEPALFVGLERVGGSPGRLLVERLQAPFSYQVAWRDFARRVELRDLNGKLVRELGAIKLREGVPVEGVVTGPRQFWASPHGDGAIFWVEALDGGDPKTKAAQRDRLLRLDPPYLGEARELHRTAGRLVDFSFAETPERALVTEYDRDRRWLAVDLLALDASAPPQRLQDRSMRDRYGDPGQPLLRTLANGRAVIRVDAGDLLLVGQGAGPAGDRPFIDRRNLVGGQSVRLFQSGAADYERPLTLLADGRLLSSRESASEPPNLRLRSGPALAQVQAVTRHADPTPQLRAIQRELVKFKRADGVELSFWLYLPPDYKPGERRPTFVWAYPLEFSDGATAAQVSGSSSRFNSFAATSPLMLLLDGYVVLMDATMPVVGEPKTVNDTFVEQITANAKAIIDKAVELGVSERSQMVVGGHSYGAFMTANLLAHTDLFKAGIARSGAYNRSLTPFGFQSERRNFWEAQDVYLRLSPFNYADKIKAPILLIHGEMDDNPGTFPIQSQRLYQALAGTGGNVRYVTLPFESHGYSARESQGHVLREMSDWMKRQTRDPRAAAPVQTTQ